MNTHSLRFRMTAWYAGLLAGALLVFGVSLYLGLERYLYSNLHSALASQCRTIGTELLPQVPVKRGAWLATDEKSGVSSTLLGRHEVTHVWREVLEPCRQDHR